MLLIYCITLVTELYIDLTPFSSRADGEGIPVLISTNLARNEVLTFFTKVRLEHVSVCESVKINVRRDGVECPASALFKRKPMTLVSTLYQSGD